MKIVHILAGKIWGGAEQYALDLGKTMASRGHKVAFVARPAAAVTRRLDAEHDLDLTYLKLGGRFDSRSVKALTHIIDGADTVHIHDIHDLPMVVRAQRRCAAAPRIVLTRHIARASRTPLWDRRYLASLHRIIFVSDLSRRLWTGANPGFPQQRCVTVINSIHPIPTDRSRHDTAGDTVQIGFTGRIRRSKGCAVLIEALARVADRPWHMTFVGACKPADYIERLKQAAARAGIADRITFTGFRSDVQQLVAGFDIGVAPSIVREACPLSPMEYMQQGVAVVASDNGAQPEYITDGVTGLLVPPGDVDALAAALARLLDDPGLRRRLGAAGRRYFDECMSYDSFVGQVEQAYL